MVATRIADGSDYIKIVADVPGPSQQVLNALVRILAAHKAGKNTIMHAASREPFRMAVESGTYVLTHVPVDAPIEVSWAERLRDDGRVVVSTLTMEDAAMCCTLHHQGSSSAPKTDVQLAYLRKSVRILPGGRD